MKTKKKTFCYVRQRKYILESKWYNIQEYEHMNTIVTYYKLLAFFQKKEVIALR